MTGTQKRKNLLVLVSRFLDDVTELVRKLVVVAKLLDEMTAIIR
jgi:hypothetical protein